MVATAIDINFYEFINSAKEIDIRAGRILLIRYSWSLLDLHIEICLQPSVQALPAGTKCKCTKTNAKIWKTNAKKKKQVIKAKCRLTLTQVPKLMSEVSSQGIFQQENGEKKIINIK